MFLRIGLDSCFKGFEFLISIGKNARIVLFGGNNCFGSLVIPHMIGGATAKTLHWDAFCRLRSLIFFIFSESSFGLARECTCLSCIGLHALISNCLSHLKATTAVVLASLSCWSFFLCARESRGVGFWHPGKISLTMSWHFGDECNK